MPKKQSKVTRRDFLKYGAVAGAAVGVGSLLGPGVVAAAPAEQAADKAPKKDEVGAGKFKVEIQGCPVASANVESITVEDLNIDVREMTTGTDVEYRIYGPGDAHSGSITVRARVGRSSKELYQWWLDTSRGQKIRKSISVICLRRDGTEARRFNFLECYPVRWDPGDYSPSSNVACETIVCKMGRVELA